MNEIREYLKTIDGIDINTFNGLVNYFQGIIDLFGENEIVIHNLLNQVKKHFKGVQIVPFNNDDFGRQSAFSGYIELSDKLDENNFLNTLLHEVTHSLGVNSGKSDNIIFDINRGLKPGAMDDFWWGINKDWIVDGNYYGIGDGTPLILFDEWITEWIANNFSNGVFNEIKTDDNGYFRLKTSSGYDGSNIMNLLELIYGKRTIVDLSLGLTLTDEERKKVVPLYGFKKMDELSKSVLTEEERNSINSKQFQNPNNTALLMTYISEYCKSDNYTDSLIKMMNLLTRQLKVKFQNELLNVNNSNDMVRMLNDIGILQRTIIWNTDIKMLKQHEYFNNYEEIVNMYINKVKEYEPNFNVESIKKTPQDMLFLFEKMRSQTKVDSKNIKL